MHNRIPISINRKFKQIAVILRQILITNTSPYGFKPKNLSKIDAAQHRYTMQNKALHMIIEGNRGKPIGCKLHKVHHIIHRHTKSVGLITLRYKQIRIRQATKKVTTPHKHFYPTKWRDGIALGNIGFELLVRHGLLGVTLKEAGYGFNFKYPGLIGIISTVGFVLDKTLSRGVAPGKAELIGGKSAKGIAGAIRLGKVKAPCRFLLKIVVLQR